MLDAGLPVLAFFTTSAQGNMAHHVGEDVRSVDAARAALESAAGAPVAYMSQVHGASVATLSTDTLLHAPEADALVSTTPGIAVAVMVADCVPILLHDATTGAVAAVHAGRAGLLAGVVTRAVEALLAHGAEAETITASIGPSICGRCYEVPQQMQRDFTALRPETASTTSWGTPALDLPAGVARELARAGVAQVVSTHHCTFEDARWFSHRRAPGEGRFVGLVVCAGRVATAD